MMQQKHSVHKPTVKCSEGWGKYYAGVLIKLTRGLTESSFNYFNLGIKVADFSQQKSWRFLSAVGAYWKHWLCIVALFEIREIIQNGAILDFNAGQVSDDIIKLLFVSMLDFLTTKGKNC